MKKIVLLSVLAGLMVGQGCPPAAISPRTSDIPEGAYSGTESATISVYVNGDLFKRSTFDDVAATPTVFGSDGLPKATDNQPVYIGYRHAEEGGIGTGSATVTAINTFAGGLQLLFDIDVTADLGDGNQIRLLGTASDTYALNDDGTLDYASSISVSGVYQGKTVLEVANSSGTLSQ